MSEKVWSVSTRDISIDSRCLYKFYLFSTCQMIRFEREEAAHFTEEENRLPHSPTL